MTSETLAEARRCMTLCVPRAGDADADAGAGRMVRVSFSLIGFGGERLVFRLVDGQDELLDPAVAGALRDCIILAERLAGRADPVAAPQDGGAG